MLIIVYRRLMYNRCLNKSGKEYWLPIDRNNKGYFYHLAAQHYKNIYTSFAKYVQSTLFPLLVMRLHGHEANAHTSRGDMSSVSRYLMPPIHSTFTSRIARRKNIQLDWKMLSDPKCKIMSHRASVLGDDAPDSAYRQLVMRITSTQSVSIKSTDAAKKDAAYYGSGKPETVVEYMVMQRRVINGREDKDWKIWGFTKESTQKQLREDEQYWKETVNASAA
jgi:protein MBA1